MSTDRRPAREPGTQTNNAQNAAQNRAAKAHQKSGSGFSAGNTDDSKRGRGRESGHYNRDDE